MRHNPTLVVDICSPQIARGFLARFPKFDWAIIERIRQAYNVCSRMLRINVSTRGFQVARASRFEIDVSDFYHR